MNKLTGNKQTDFLVLQQLTDHELGKVCQVNKYVNSLCQDNNFWLNRIVYNFKNLDHEVYNFKNLNHEEVSKMKDYLEFETFKELYQYLRNIIYRNN